MPLDGFARHITSLPVDSPLLREAADKVAALAQRPPPHKRYVAQPPYEAVKTRLPLLSKPTSPLDGPPVNACPARR